MEELLQGLEQLLVSQPGTLVRFRIFHVAFGKTLQAYPYRFAVDTPQDFGFSKSMESFRVAPDGAVRRLLDSPSVLIVICNPPDMLSSIDSHAALFLPSASRVLILSGIRGARIYNSPASRA